MEEKPIMEVFKHAVIGELPTAIAFYLRKRLFDDGADLQTLRKYNHLVTAKGR